jgi:hypothetical protein
VCIDTSVRGKKTTVSGKKGSHPMDRVDREAMRMLGSWSPYIDPYGDIGSMFQGRKGNERVKDKEIRENFAGRRVGPLKLHVPVSPTR